MTQKLYYEDQYIKEFSAEIINIIEKDSEFHIELDKTAFFHGLSGQLCDTGSIEDSLITHVYEEAGIIYHVSSKKPVKIHRVKCEIDWEIRFDSMQQYLGKHILSSAFLELFRGNISNFSFEKHCCKLDLDKVLTPEELEQVELLANNKIFANKAVEFLAPTKAELKKLSLRKAATNSQNETLRVVKIDDIDTDFCSVLYPKSTLEVQIISIKKTEKLKGNIMRIEFICGKRAVLHALSNYRFSSRLCQNLKCNDEEVLNKIEILTSEFNKLMDESKKMKSQIADFEVQDILKNCETIGNVRIFKAVISDSDMKYINMMALKLTSFENVIALYAVKSEGMATLLFMCSKNLKIINMNDLLKDAISLIDGKGGGSAFSAQGGGKGVNNVESALDYAFAKIKNRGLL